MFKDACRQKVSSYLYTTNMKLSALLFLFCLSSAAFAGDSLWHILPQKEVEAGGKRTILPKKYIVIQLNDSLFRSMQSSGKDSMYWPLPVPDGSMKTFKVWTNSTLSKELADKYPELQTYRGTEIGNPLVRASFDHTIAGFHAMVLDGEDSYFIDPYSNVPSAYYICYYKRDFEKPSSQKSIETSVKKKCCKKKQCRRKNKLRNK